MVFTKVVGDDEDKSNDDFSSIGVPILANLSYFPPSIDHRQGSIFQSSMSSLGKRKMEYKTTVLTYI